MVPLLESVSEYFAQGGWLFHRGDGESALSTAVTSTKGSWICHVQVIEEDELVFFYSVCPATAPAQLRVGNAEFLMQINRRVYMGHFLLDFHPGEIRYETLMHHACGMNLQPALEATVGGNIAMMNTYLAGILRVMHSDVTPADAMPEIETGNRRDRSYVYN